MNVCKLHGPEACAGTNVEHAMDILWQWGFVQGSANGTKKKIVLEVEAVKLGFVYKTESGISIFNGSTMLRNKIEALTIWKMIFNILTPCMISSTKFMMEIIRFGLQSYRSSRFVIIYMAG